MPPVAATHRIARVAERVAQSRFAGNGATRLPMIQNKGRPKGRPTIEYGGADETRTRDLRRDRPAFYPAELRPRIVSAQGWWEVGDLNPRPPACKAGALTAELTSQTENRRERHGRGQRFVCQASQITRKMISNDHVRGGGRAAIRNALRPRPDNLRDRYAALQCGLECNILWP
jgi:hypothetical protein